MLTDDQKRVVADICRRKKIGMVDFKDNGMIRIFNFIPVLRPVTEAFPGFVISDHGTYPLLEDRTDDLRQVHWVDLLPDAYDVGA